MTKYKRKRKNEGGSKIIACFVVTSLVLSLFFAISSIYVSRDQAKKDDNETKPSNDMHVESIPITNGIDKLEKSNTEQEQINNSGSSPNYHIVFSTDCSGYQKWQSYLLFYSAFKVDQPGTVTRIASGCSEEEEAAERNFQDSISKHMSTNFKLHLTPHFSKVKDAEGKATTKKYLYFNKPFGLLHWIEHSEEKIMDDDIIILLDPDQVLTRPITDDFSDTSKNLLVGKNPKIRVTHSSPFAQKYGFRAAWQNLDIDMVTGTKDSPAKNVSRKDAAEYYPAGPPYLATAKDMHLLARTWADFVPRAHKNHPHLMAEMYAFCIAAAHLELPHQIVRSLMVSNVDGGTGENSGEGWKLVHAIDNAQVCSATVSKEYTLPSVLHYCQRYILGSFFFGKRRMPHDIFSCESPLLQAPPTDISLRYDYALPPSSDEKKQLNANSVKQNAFMICYLTDMVNEAALFYQAKNCQNSKNENVVIEFRTGKTVSKKA